ncbi:MAG: leucine-rich repeat domain-containing protein [Bacteroidia bacterium]|jgi:Leucine-rich repeat (LRR) protein|nr:leucine-rich repeat domain-containing protein [Bacteroidia bacterium]
MKFLALCFIVAFPSLVRAQSPWMERMGPPGSPVYTDLKMASREAALVYKMHLTGTFTEKQLRVLPEFQQMQGLQLSQNGWSNLPAPFYTLSSLLYLRSEGNPLLTLSDSTPLPVSLRYVELAGTAFDTLPRALVRQGALSMLTISKNSDTLRFPALAGQWPFLTGLHLMNLTTDSTLWHITSLKRLEKLSLYNCNLTTLSPTISSLTSLQELNLTGNKLTSLPRGVTELTQLKRLVLRNNQLTHLSSRICFLTSLEVLDLRGNPMTLYEVECIKVLLPRCDVLFDGKE